MRAMLYVAFAVACVSQRARAQVALHILRGEVRSSVDNKPLSGAVVQLSAVGLSRRVRSDERGRYVLTELPSSTYQISVTRIGYVAVTRTVTVGDSDAELNITMTPTAQALDATQIRANVTAIYGGIGAAGPSKNARGERELTAVAGAAIQVIGAGKSTESDSTGRFFLELPKAGTYMVRLSRPGLTQQLFPVEVPRNQAVDVSRLMDSTRSAPPVGRDYLWREMDKRLQWHAMNSALVPGAEVRDAGGSLTDALQRSRSMTLRGLRIGPRTCVFIDGIARPGMPLDAIRPEEIEAVELYGERGDPTGSLVQSWPPNATCGEASRLPPRPNGAIAIPYAKWAVIWTVR